VSDAERYARVKRLFFEASRLPGDERRAFLDSSCGDDDDLRSEVERLLTDDPQSTAHRAVRDRGGAGSRLHGSGLRGDGRA
jgi:hypothetical protein